MLPPTSAELEGGSCGEPKPSRFAGCGKVGRAVAGSDVVSGGGGSCGGLPLPLPLAVGVGAAGGVGARGAPPKK